MNNPNPKSNAERQREATLRTANGVFAVWEKRTQLVKDETAAANAALDANTARLKALRLEKEKLEAEAAALAPPPPPKKAAAKVRRINAG